MLLASLSFLGFYTAIFVLGFIMGSNVTSLRIYRNIFHPWLDSMDMSPGPEFWLRIRDYEAAQNGFHRGDLLKVARPTATSFDTPPKYSAPLTP